MGVWRGEEGELKMRGSVDVMEVIDGCIMERQHTSSSNGLATYWTSLTDRLTEKD